MTSARGNSSDVAGEDTGGGEEKEGDVEINSQLWFWVSGISNSDKSCSLVMFRVLSSSLPAMATAGRLYERCELSRQYFNILAECNIS